MSAGCLRWLLSQAVGRAVHGFVTPRKLPHLPLTCRPAPESLVCGAVFGVPHRLCTTADAEGEVPGKKKQDLRARSTVSSVGRKIHQRHLQVMGADGENLGTMHRADVLRLMDQQGLKLVPVSLNKEPPVYKLMTGKQIYQEQLKLREKQKAKAGPVQVKELTFSSDIGPHDLETKLRQILSWLEKKHQVRVTLRKGGGAKAQTLLDVELERITQSMPCAVGYVAKPKLIRDGRVAMCILRAPTEKELQQQQGSQKSAPASKQAAPASTSGPEGGAEERPSKQAAPASTSGPEGGAAGVPRGAEDLEH